MARPRTSTPLGSAPSALGDNLARLRKQRGLTQAQLSEMVGVSLAHIARIEIGQYQPSVSLIPKLMAALEVSADALLTPMPAPSTEEQRLADLIEGIRGLLDWQRDMVSNHVDIYRHKRRMKVLFLPVPTDEQD